MAAKKSKKKRKYTKRKKNFGFGAISVPASTSASKMTHKELLGVAGSFVAGVVLAHAIGNNLMSVGSGVVVGGAGAYKKNVYLAALGVGMVFTTPVSILTQNMNGLPEDEVNGFSFKNFTSGAKQRVGTFFTSFKDKFKLPKQASTETPTETTTEGFGSVYQSPFTQLRQPDLSELDRLEKQIEQMNGLFGDDDLPNREF